MKNADTFSTSNTKIETQRRQQMSTSTSHEWSSASAPIFQTKQLAVNSKYLYCNWTLQSIDIITICVCIFGD